MDPKVYTTTIYDVAKRSNVSLATVSRVINSPEKVRESTRIIVLKAIEDLGFHPNTLARSLATSRSTTVGIFVSDITRASVAEVLNGIMDVAFNYHYSVKLFSCNDSEKLDEVIDVILGERIDGLIVLNDELDEDSVLKLSERLKYFNISTIFANVGFAPANFFSVTADYEDMGYKLTKLLIEHQRKNIYLLTTVRNYSVNLSKEIGYKRAMQEAGLKENIIRTSGDVQINQKHFETFFTNPANKADGVIAVRDSMAVSFINVASRFGSKIPEEIEVCGFQNTKYALLSNPTLTSIELPVYDLGSVAMRLLTKLMENNTEVENIVLPYKIIMRNTTK